MQHLIPKDDEDEFKTKIKNSLLKKQGNQK